MNFPPKKGQSGQEGSMTVELAMIFPIIFILLLLLFYMVMITYDRAAAQAVINHQASQASLFWGEISKEGDYDALSTGDIDAVSSSVPLYWQIGLMDGQAQKRKQVEEQVKRDLNRLLLLSPQSIQIDVDYSNYFLFQRIEVRASLEYNDPLAKLLYRGSCIIEVETRTYIKDEAERIRNLDFAAEMLEEYPGTAALKDKYFQALDKGKSWIADFFR